jgi:hypothetical protein
MRYLTLVLLVASPAFAQLNYVSQSRSITAYAGFIAPPQSVSSAGFGTFDNTLDITGANPDNQPDSNGFAYQHSELLPAGVVMQGRLGGTDNYPYAGFGEGAGYSLLDVSFTVTQPVPFHLSASESRNPGASTEWAVMLSQGSTTLFDWEAKPFSSIAITVDGTLQPGTYRLYGAWYDGWHGSSYGTRFSDYALSFAVPEPFALAPCALLGLALRRRQNPKP